MNTAGAIKKPNLTNKKWLAIGMAGLLVVLVFGGMLLYFIHQTNSKSNRINSLQSTINSTQDKLKQAESSNSQLKQVSEQRAKESEALQKQIADLQQSQTASTYTPKEPKLVLSVTNVSAFDTIEGASVWPYQRHVFVDVTLKNVGNALATLTYEQADKGIKFVDTNNVPHFTTVGGMAPQLVGKRLLSTQNIAPGETVSGSYYFQLDKTITSGSMRFNEQVIDIKI